MPKEVKWAIALVAGSGLIALGWKFHWFLVTFHIVLCIVLILVVLVQSGKAADLAGAFGGMGSQTAFGPRGAASFLTRATTWCAIMFMFTSVSMVLTQTRSASGGSSVLDNAPTQQAPAEPVLPPVQGAPAPQQTPPPASSDTQTTPAPAQTPPAKSPDQPKQ